jgi:hypothetical protein
LLVNQSKLQLMLLQHQLQLLAHKCLQLILLEVRLSPFHSQHYQLQRQLPVLL